MKILITCQHYWPEPFRVINIAEKLVSDGNDVTVLTGYPNYPEGYIYDGYKNKIVTKEEHNGVKIIRCPLIPRKKDVVHRVLNYYSFAHSASKEVKNLDKNFDVVLAIGLSPVMMIEPALKYKELYGTKVVLYLMDLWPASLLAGGIKKNSLVYKHYQRLSNSIYSRCDAILVSSKTQISYLYELIGHNQNDISFCPQYSEDIFKEVKSQQINTTKDFVFAGNIGKAQQLDVVVNAAELLKDRKDIRFVIYGDGSELSTLKEISNEKHCKNIIFKGQQNIKKMVEAYSNAYAMILTLEHSDYSDLTLPGKIQSYMCAGKAIVGAASGYTQEIIEESNCGLCVNAEDYKGFARIVTELADSPDISIYEQNSKKYYEENFSKDKFFDILNKKLKEYAK